jgi:flagellar biosynthesis protein FlhG
VLVFASGKSGVGKTSITTNVATAMVQRGARVCIFDADSGIANVTSQLGLKLEYCLDDVLNGEKSIQEIVLKTKANVAVVPEASRVAECAYLSREQIRRLSEALRELETKYDYFLIDTAAGGSETVVQFIESAPYTFIVITPDPTSLTDAFTLLKRLNERDYSGRLRVIVNMAVDYPSATETYRRFVSVVDKYLSLKVEYGGFVAHDESMPKSVSQQTPVIDLAGNTPSSRCLFALADNLLKYIGADNYETGFSEYWTSFLQDNSHHIDLLPDENRISEVDQPILAASEHPLAPTKLPIDELMSQLLSAVKSNQAEKPILENFISEFVTAFREQFGGFPDEFKALLFRWLEAENYAAPRLQELMGTLEALYQARHQQPIHSLEDSAARLIAQCQGSQIHLASLIKQLRAAYLQSFQMDVIDAKQEVLDSIRRYDYSEAQYQSLQDALGQAYAARFKRPYQHPSETRLESVAVSLANLAAEEQNLQAQLTALNNSFQQISLRRQTLQDEIADACSDKKPYTSLT